MNVFRTLLLIAVVAALSPAGSVAADAWVARIVFSHSLDRGCKCPGDPLTPSKIVPSKPLFLWALIKGRDGALKSLRKSGKLPLRHRWTFAFKNSDRFHSAGEVLLEDEWTTVPDLTKNVPQSAGEMEELAVGIVNQLGELEHEIASSGDGTFDWRLWSMKANLQKGIYRVDILWADGEVLLMNGKPCTLWVPIQ